MRKNTIFQRYFLPGFLFQSVIIGGGYATGRELVEFFLIAGPLAGLFGLLVSALAFSLLLGLGFELSRMTKTFDYRTFFMQLLGPGWFLFEVLWAAMVLLILAVLGAASGELVATHFGLPAVVGIVGMLVLVAVLVFWGTSLIEKVLAGWSFLLYITYAILIFAYLSKHGGQLLPNFAADDLQGPWLVKSLQYVGMTVTALPMILFCVRHMESRRDAFIAGAIAGPIGMIPAILFFLGLAASYPEILQVPVPADYMIQRLEFGWIEALFYLVVFGTFVETGSAIIHAINERIDHVFLEKSLQMPQWLRPAVAIVTLFIAIVMANAFGIIELIAKGYTTLAWGFVIVVLIPLVTVGTWRVFGPNRPG